MKIHISYKIKIVFNIFLKQGTGKGVEFGQSITYDFKVLIIYFSFNEYWIYLKNDQWADKADPSWTNWASSPGGWQDGAYVVCINL